MTSVLNSTICTKAMAWPLPPFDMQTYRMSILGFEYSKLRKKGFEK